ncbi:hypothetical protein [Bifidobacterium sp. SO4]|uniref:hypothetical protein n=1 Tax=Bifidobacterium sp. SO4 TaxID=2809030 RepID=UPI001BDC77FC|nr:hypothetical protein [Bifidobacterium sp. SO4]MBT1169626.1 hypothetical protein [Bifidobacterium sp. SO4]
MRDIDNDVVFPDTIAVLDERFDSNEPSYVLQATAGYLIETAYELHRLTVTRDAEHTARCLALCAYATHIRPASIAFSATNGDLPALRMLLAALLLCADARTTLTTSPFPMTGHTIIRTDKADTAIGDPLERGLLPTRARGDLHAMKQRLSASAARLGHVGRFRGRRGVWQVICATAAACRTDATARTGWADIPDWTALSTAQLLAIRTVKGTGLWLNKNRHRTQQARNHRMKDITMTAPITGTTASTSTADKRASLLSRQLIQAPHEQTEAQNRIADNAR